MTLLNQHIIILHGHAELQTSFCSLLFLVQCPRAVVLVKLQLQHPVLLHLRVLFTSGTWASSGLCCPMALSRLAPCRSPALCRFGKYRLLGCLLVLLSNAWWWWRLDSQAVLQLRPPEFLLVQCKTRPAAVCTVRALQAWWLVGAIHATAFSGLAQLLGHIAVHIYIVLLHWMRPSRWNCRIYSQFDAVLG